MKPPNFQKKIYRLFRRITRILSFPAWYLPEGQLKNSVRRTILKFQHALPRELEVNSGDTVIQVGTPWPKTILSFSRMVGPAGRVIVFEAMPDNQARLEKGILELALTNTKLVKAAASSSCGTGKLAISPIAGDHKIPLSDIKMDNDLRFGNENMDMLEVPFLTIDHVVDDFNIEDVHFISITVNGAELEVIKGALETLSKAPVKSRVHVKGHAFQADGTPLNKRICEELQNAGYSTLITKGEWSSAPGSGWERRAGDVFGWKEKKII